MTEQDLIALYRRERPAFEAFGNHVKTQVLDALVRELGTMAKVRYFIKIPPEPRLKEESSIVEKAFFRNKAYGDPYADITDKVGIRFVVLLSTDVPLVNAAIERNSTWTFSKDRDFAEERKRLPLIFDYQSDHYIVRAQQAIKVGQVVIPAGTPCEVQVRTLLQHAYSELAHDTVYKAPVKPESDVYRAFSRSMAMIETTDEQLTKAAHQIRDTLEAVERLCSRLRSAYLSIAGRVPEETRLHRTILNAYLQDPALMAAADAELDNFFATHKFLGEELQRRWDFDPIARQAAILLLLFALKQDRFSAEALWPLQPPALDPFHAMLGMSRA